jgi:hypothetical protein
MEIKFVVVVLLAILCAMWCPISVVARPVVGLAGSAFTYALGECVGRASSMKCLGLGPNSTRPHPHIEHLELASLLWSPTRGTVLQIFPNLQVRFNLLYSNWLRQF